MRRCFEVKKYIKRFALLLFSLMLVFYMFPASAIADVPEMRSYVTPAQPRNQAQTNSLATDIFGSPTNAAPSNIIGTAIDIYVDNQNAIRDSYLNTARNYERAYERSGSIKSFDRMVRAENASSVAGLKGMGANYAGKVFGGYCLVKDISEYNDKSKHRHSSIAFIDQTLRGFNITAGALDYGGMKLAKPLAIGGGIMKDIVGGDSFSDWANQQDNIVLEYSDWVIDNVNEGTYNAFLYYMELFNNTDDANVYGRPPYGTGVYKPNIYLYSEAATRITVSFALPALLTSTIPQYEQQWVVDAYPDGTLTDIVNGADYKYLFYESETDASLFNYGSGWVLLHDTREAQFNDILTGYGFNDREIADFIDFWAKKLGDGVDYVMYPQLTEEVDKAMPIKVSPTPVNRFRLWFAFRTFDGRIPAAPVISAMNREGYSLVEWGGFIPDKR